MMTNEEFARQQLARQAKAMRELIEPLKQESTNQSPIKDSDNAPAAE
ncbi:hypothetical protein [Desulfobulbus sp.]|nr:hypothetical protein [Desulfobulbus sp.]